jgi:hypothetical protein
LLAPFLSFPSFSNFSLLLFLSSEAAEKNNTIEAKKARGDEAEKGCRNLRRCDSFFSGPDRRRTAVAEKPQTLKPQAQTEFSGQQKSWVLMGGEDGCRNSDGYSPERERQRKQKSRESEKKAEYTAKRRKKKKREEGSKTQKKKKKKKKKKRRRRRKKKEEEE